MKLCSQEKIYQLVPINGISSGFGNFIKDAIHLLTRYRETISKNSLRPVRCIVKNSKIELNQVLVLAKGSGS